MKKQIPHLVTLLMVLLTACENEIPFNIKDNSPKLIINALINADSVSNTVYLNFTGKSQLGNVKDAIVNVYVNDILTETAQAITEQSETISQSKFLITSTFHPGDIIRIDATAHTSNIAYHAWAEVSVPQRPQIVSVDTCTIMLKTSTGFRKHLRYKIRIKDREDEANFYRIIIEQQSILDITSYNGKDTTTIIKSYHMITREDVVLTDGHPTTSDDEDNGLFEEAQNIYSIFDDGRFTNKEYTLTIYTNSLEERWSPYGEVKQCQVDVKARLLSITEAEYYYLKALNIIDSDAYIEGINEPIKFPSNVQGGTGLVGVSTEHQYLLHLPIQTFLQ